MVKSDEYWILITMVRLSRIDGTLDAAELSYLESFLEGLELPADERASVHDE